MNEILTSLHSRIIKVASLLPLPQRLDFHLHRLFEYFNVFEFHRQYATKVHKIWMHDYSNENTSNDAFHFSLSVAELEFQQISFLAYHFFITFIRKLTQVLILTLFFRVLGCLTEKRKTLTDFPL